MSVVDGKSTTESSHRLVPHGSFPRPTPHGEKTRNAILRIAMDIASVDGLEGLTIGRLAEAVGMSKSGLFAHFGSKEDLQLATIDSARQLFHDLVLVQATNGEPGLPRLMTLVESWAAYIENKTWPGGCFFAQAAADFDSRPGAVRDRVIEVMKEWLGTIETVITEAIEQGHLSANTDVKQLVFEINGLTLAANWSHQLLNDEQALRRAVQGIHARIFEVGGAGVRPPMRTATA